MKDLIFQSGQQRLILLNSIFTTVLVVSNFLSAKVANLWGFLIPAGTIGYAITFLVTDIISEQYDKGESQKAVLRGAIALVISFALARIAILLPGQVQGADDAYRSIFSSATRVMIGSICGYLASQSLDIVIFHRIKKATDGKYKFLRNNVGTITSQIVDTVIFSLVAFYGLVPNIWSLILDLIIAKTVLAILDTPFFYLFTRRPVVKENEEA